MACWLGGRGGGGLKISGMSETWGAITLAIRQGGFSVFPKAGICAYHQHVPLQPSLPTTTTTVWILWIADRLSEIHRHRHRHPILASPFPIGWDLLQLREVAARMKITHVSFRFITANKIWLTDSITDI